VNQLVPVPFRDRSPAAKLVLAGIIPAALGALAGVMLGVSAGAYWAVGAVAALGGILAGAEHSDDREAMGRGAVAGAIYGAALLIAHAIAGTDAKVSLGGFPPVLILITAIIGLVLTVIGERISRRRSQPPPRD
jgi:hypothetical protein